MAIDAINILQDSNPIVNKKVELLRPLEKTVGQFDALIGWPFQDQPGKGNSKDPAKLPCSGADDQYTDADKNFLEDFKKIFHLGSDQADTFITNLSDSGDDLDPESVLYYVNQLLNGPFAPLANAARGEGRANFKEAPDIMGVIGDHSITLGILRGEARPNSSAPVGGSWAPTNAAALTYNKCPEFIKTLLGENTANVQGIYNSSSQALRVGEIIMPQIDKLVQYRVSNENVVFVRDPADPQAGRLQPDAHVVEDPEAPPGWGTEDGDGLLQYFGLYPELRVLQHDGQNHRTHGNIGVKDVEFYNTLIRVGPEILSAVDDFIGRDDWNLCVFRKSINYFNPNKNKAVSENQAISRVLEYIVREFGVADRENTGEETITTETTFKETDLFGNAFVSDERMKFELKIPDHKGQGDDATFKLYTVEGQLGSGKGEPDPQSIINEC
tara:strand:- start:1129 stop:2454 length:1326 start_codon:yes stop_codon:yes gene_type:complete